MNEALRQRVFEAVSRVVDPELPMLTVADLGILRDVTVDAEGRIEVAITPTYSGCPATELIVTEVRRALDRAGVGNARVRTVLFPPWTTDWITEAGRRKLAASGIAPPSRAHPDCPNCGAGETEMISAFGSTPCKALWRCRACGEPFDRFKCH